MKKPWAVLLCTALILPLLGCSDVASRRTSYNLTGVWFGALYLGCAGHCFSQPEISFTLFEQPAESGVSTDAGLAGTTVRIRISVAR
jgi:hypothetical protein